MSATSGTLAADTRPRLTASAPVPAATGLMWLLVLYLVLEYVRPALVVQLRLQLGLVILLPWLCATRIPDRPWPPILKAQILILLFCAATVPFRYNYYAAYMVARTMLGHVAIAATLVWLLGEMATFRRVILIWLLIMGYLAGYGILHGGTGPGGFLGDENDLGLALVAALPLAFFAAERANALRLVVWLGFMALLVAGVVATFSRGTFVGLAAAVATCLVLSRHKARTLAVFAIGGFLFVATAPPEYVDELYSIRAEATGEQPGTGETRRFLWLTAFNMWKAHPVFGVGGDNFSFQAGVYRPEWEGRDYQERDWTGTTVHSIYFQLLSEQGAVGLGLWIFVVASHFGNLRSIRRRVRRDDRVPPDFRMDVEAYASALAAAMIGVLASGAFLSVAYYPYVYYLSAFGAALALATDRHLAKLNADSQEGGACSARH